MPLMSLETLTYSEMAVELGVRLRRLRIRKNLEQAELARRADISLRTLRGLEHGKNSTTETLLRVLKALEVVRGLEMLAPMPGVSPMALLRQPAERQRVRRRRGGKA